MRKILLYVLLVALGCSVGKDVPKPVPKTIVDIPVQSERLDTTYDAANNVFDAIGLSINWEDPDSDFITKAVSEKKWIILWFYSDGCDFCKQMERNVFHDLVIVNTINKYFISVNFDVEEYPENFYYFVMRQFPDEMIITPSTVFISPEGLTIVIRGNVTIDKFAYMLNRILSVNGLQESASKY